jgi:hypothetical protein
VNVRRQYSVFFRISCLAVFKMHRFDVRIAEEAYFPFRRWLRARDPDASIKVKPRDGDLWECEVRSHFVHLRRRARRTWSPDKL